MRSVYRARRHPTASPANRRFTHLLTDTPIDLVVRSGLRRKIPVRHDLFSLPSSPQKSSLSGGPHIVPGACFNDWFGAGLSQSAATAM